MQRFNNRTEGWNKQQQKRNRWGKCVNLHAGNFAQRKNESGCGETNWGGSSPTCEASEFGEGREEGGCGRRGQLEAEEIRRGKERQRKSCMKAEQMASNAREDQQTKERRTLGRWSEIKFHSNKTTKKIFHSRIFTSFLNFIFTSSPHNNEISCRAYC